MIGLAISREHSFHRKEKPKTVELQIITVPITVPRDSKNISLVNCLEFVDMIFSFNFCYM
jgi:hypothetical protein